MHYTYVDYITDTDHKYKQKMKAIHMKKIFVVTAITAFFIVSLSSCKTHEKCPAYAKAVKSHTEVTVKNS